MNAEQHWQQQNVAGDNAHVGQQNAVNYGDTTFHETRTYIYNQWDPPEKKFAVAVSQLNGGIVRPARENLGNLMKSGFTHPDLPYYFALATLSGRSVAAIDTDTTECLQEARRAAGQFGVGETTGALMVMVRLVDRILEHSAGATDTTALNAVVDEVNQLPGNRQFDITWHLKKLLDGAAAAQLVAGNVAQLSEARMSGDRAARAWKFFQPEPTAPRTFAPSRTPVSRQSHSQLIRAALLMVLGLAALVAGIAGIAAAGRVVLVVLAIPVGGAGWYLRVRYQRVREVAARRLAVKNLDHCGPVPGEIRSPGHWVSTDFVHQIDWRFKQRFAQAGPGHPSSWPADTTAIRDSLTRRFVALYGNAQVKPSQLNYLIRWHARRIAEQWRTGTLFAYQTELAQTGSADALAGLGVAVAAAGVLGVALGGTWCILAAIVLAVAGHQSAAAAVDIAADREIDEIRAAEEAELAQQEWQEFQRWTQRLQDRPDDPEMARWLALDTLWLKQIALQRYGLAETEVFDDLVMTKPGPPTWRRRAKIPRGPFRYSAYTVMVFLLTDAGVRELDVDLNFTNGSVRDERRTSFGYDALASAHVSETGRRVTDSVTGADTNGLAGREFRLRLTSGDEVTAVTENFADLGAVDPAVIAELQQTELDSSGITDALHTLETIAAEGREWIPRERLRRQHRG